MAAIPEEIPVAFSSFMALGAWRMSKLGIITRQPQTIENLGAVTVICLDKTGTITKDKMKVHAVYDFRSDKYIELGGNIGYVKSDVLYLVCSAKATHSMQWKKAILDAYFYSVSKGPQLIYEYPLKRTASMMTHTRGRIRKINCSKRCSRKDHQNL
jgi:Ca2+-transporting ATPase